MTRKRFVKLLMSCGYSRNEAREESAWVIETTKIYEKFNKNSKEKKWGLRFFARSYTDAYRKYYACFAERMTE